MSKKSTTGGNKSSTSAGMSDAASYAAATGRYPLTPLEEDVLRLEIVRRLTELRCRRCTKKKCRRAKPCQRLVELDRSIAQEQVKVDAQTAARQARLKPDPNPPGDSQTGA